MRKQKRTFCYLLLVLVLLVHSALYFDNHPTISTTTIVVENKDKNGLLPQTNNPSEQEEDLGNDLSQNDSNHARLTPGTDLLPPMMSSHWKGTLQTPAQLQLEWKEVTREEAENFFNASCPNLKIERFFRTRSCRNVVRKTMFFHHVGKAGTGTIGQIIGGFLQNYCHQKACPQRVVAAKEGQKKDPIIHLINIRDPVTRFQSGFDFASTISCFLPPSKEPRKVSKRRSWEDPLHFCSNKHQESKVLDTFFERNVNRAAEQFCEIEKDSGKDKTLQDLPVWNHVKDITHISYRLVEWLKPYFEAGTEGPEMQSSRVYQSSNPDIAMIVMESLAKDPQELPFESRARRLAHYVRSRFLQDPSLMPTLETTLKEQEQLAQNKGKRHSSTMQGLSKLPALEEYGKCCLTKYYLAQDYALLHAILMAQPDEKKELYKPPNLPFLDSLVEQKKEGMISVSKQLSQVCSWGLEIDEHLCLASIQSILQGRQKYLGLETCEELYGNQAA